MSAEDWYPVAGMLAVLALLLVVHVSDWAIRRHLTQRRTNQRWAAWEAQFRATTPPPATTRKDWPSDHP